MYEKSSLRVFNLFLINKNRIYNIHYDLFQFTCIKSNVNSNTLLKS